MKPPRKPYCRALLAAVAITGLAGPVIGADQTKLPDGHTICPSSLSPDGRWGVLVPDAAHFQESSGNRLIEISNGRELAVIAARTGLDHMNHGGVTSRWTENGTGLFWLVGGKWSPRAMVYLRITDGKVAWQTDLLALSQREILQRTRAADPVAYDAAVKECHLNENDPLLGFTIDVDTIGSGADLPLAFIVSLTSDPQHLNCPLGMETCDGRLYDPRPSERKPFDAMPMRRVVEARMRGLLAANGTITWERFAAATGAKGLKRHQYMTASDWHGELPEELAAKLRKAVPDAVGAVEAYARDNHGKGCWSIALKSKPRAPDSLAVDFLMLIDSRGSGVPGGGKAPGLNFPLAGEILASLAGSLEEDGSTRWGKRVVATGNDAVRRRQAIPKDNSFQTAARKEIKSRVEQSAPESMTALRAFASTQPKQDELWNVVFDDLPLADDHPGIRPRAFSLTLEPAFGPAGDKLPMEAEFLARLEGTIQADETIAWGSFTLLRGEEARRTRRALDNARNHAGWPSF